MKKEIWKPVPSKPEILASSLGRIKLPESTSAMPNGGVRKNKPKPTFGVIIRQKGRIKKRIIQSSKFGKLAVHRLVCEAFNGKQPKNKPLVLHIDENPLNNKPENLMWGTQKENLNAPKFIEYCKSRVGEKSTHAIHRMNK